MKISAEILKLLSKYGIRTGDFKYVSLFEDFEAMAAKDDKVSYAVAVLAKKYDVSQSSVYRILKRFRATVRK